MVMICFRAVTFDGTNPFTATNLIHGDDFLTGATSVAREVGGACAHG